jgi:anti-sigma B factor antagonist
VKGIHVGQEQGAVVVTARGALDAFNAADLSAAFEEAGDGRVGRIVIDLSRVSFLDSTALGLVVRKVNEVLDLGGGACVVLPETNARRIFEITTLDRVLPIATSRRDALLALGDSGEISERGF